MSAEGHFFISIINNKTTGKVQVQLRFSISQHARDASLMKCLPEYLDCGVYRPHRDRESGEFTVTKFSSLLEKIIPFFQKYPILGVKSLDFYDFSAAADILKLKSTSP